MGLGGLPKLDDLSCPSDDDTTFSYRHVRSLANTDVQFNHPSIPPTHSRVAAEKIVSACDISPVVYRACLATIGFGAWQHSGDTVVPEHWTPFLRVQCRHGTNDVSVV